MKRLAVLICLIALNLSAPALAQQAERHGDYIIHYNTMNTRLLAPEFARAYGITRDGNRALINIAVLRVRDGELDEPVTARVSVSSSNLAGQRRDIDMIEVREQDAIYYIGTFRFRQEETLTFRISVDPDGKPRGPHEFTFRQQFYTD